MDRKEIIFRAFVRANNLGSIPDFPNHRTLYVWGSRSDSPMDAEAIMSTLEFIAFVDGIEQIPHKFENPKGTPEKTENYDDKVNNLADVLVSLGVSTPLARRMIIKGNLADHYEQFKDGIPIGIYDFQYKLGQSNSGLLRS